MVEEVGRTGGGEAGAREGGSGEGGRAGECVRACVRGGGEGGWVWGEEERLSDSLDLYTTLQGISGQSTANLSSRPFCTSLR